MLLKHRDKNSGKTLYKTVPLLTKAKAGYVRPQAGREWFATTTTVWRVDELIRRRVRDWKRIMSETGHTGSRTQSFRADHDSVYTATYSVFPAPLVEWILLRYGGEGGIVLDAFAGGPPRSVVSTIMGFEYVGFDIRQEQIDENLLLLEQLGLTGARFICGDGCLLEGVQGPFDVALTCPPYHDLEKYSNLENDLSNQASYWAFNAGMALCAQAHYPLMKSGAFVCIVVGPFRDKKTGELIDFPGHTIDNFREAGFLFWQDVILSKNFGSAAKRSTNSWRGLKLVPIHEHLLVFRKP